MMRARILYFALCAGIAGLAGGCRFESPYIDLNDAYSEIGVSIADTARRCGSEPSYPLLLPANPSEYGVRLCSLLILQQSCPFTDYPVPCLEIYTASCELCDLPLFTPE
jgi:hypothetical protein